MLVRSIHTAMVSDVMSRTQKNGVLTARVKCLLITLMQSLVVAESALELLKLLHYILEGNHYLVVSDHMLEGQRS